jgi:hypothetical protein
MQPRGPFAVLVLLLAAAFTAALSLGRAWQPPAEPPAPPAAEARTGLDAGELCALFRSRSESKRQVARDLLAGRICLLEAAARFRQLNAPPPEADTSLFRGASVFPGRTEEERLCRQVIQWAATEFEDGGRPTAASAACRRRLEGELQALLERGPVLLPPPPGADAAPRPPRGKGDPGEGADQPSREKCRSVGPN